MKANNTKSQRIKLVFSWLQNRGESPITQQAIGKLIGINSKSYLSQLIKRADNDEFINKLTKLDDRLNKEWIYTGEGEMLKTQSTNSVVTGDVSGNGNQFVAGNNNRLTTPKAEDVEDVETLEAIPVITTDQAKAPNVDVRKLVMSGSSQVKRLSIWEFFEKFGEFDAICPTYRDSMIPTYVPGDFLFIKYKQVTNESYIKQGRYLLDTREHGTILCIVEDTEDGYLTLSFKNARKYKPMRVKKEDVMSIADIVLMVRMGDMAFETVDIGALQVQLDKKDMQIDNLFAQLGSLTNQMDKQGDRTNRVIDQIEDALEQNKRLVNLMTENYLKKSK